MKQLRQYQTNGIDKIAMKAAQGKRKIIFQLATGGGKTITFAGLVNRYMARNSGKVLILVHREELLKQAHRALFEWYDIAAAPITASNTYTPNVNVYVAMVETANNRLKKNPNCFGNVGLVIVDECHIGNFKKLYEYFPNSLIIGFTATPISSSKKDPLKNHFEDIVCGVDIPELIQMSSLVKNTTYHIHNVKRTDLKIKNGEFDESQMGSVFSSAKHVQNCIKAYQKFSLGKKAIVFNCNIEHSKKVTEAFIKFGYNARHLDGESDPRYRAETLKWFKHTPDGILCNVGILTTGFDEPSVISVIVNKSTLSLPLWLQMTGRGSRPFTEKQTFIIIDLGNNAITHGDWCAPRDWADYFFNPDKAREGGEAPSKECIGCSVVIHASQHICPHCGANNQKAARYDEGGIKIQLLKSDRPFTIDIHEVIHEYSHKTKADGTAYKETAVLHVIKYKILTHAQRVWRMKKIDDSIAEELVRIYQMQIKTWCKIKNKQYTQWHSDRTREWMFAEFKRIWNWEPNSTALSK